MDPITWIVVLAGATGLAYSFVKLVEVIDRPTEKEGQKW